MRNRYEPIKSPAEKIAKIDPQAQVNQRQHASILVVLISWQDEKTQQTNYFQRLAWWSGAMQRIWARSRCRRRPRCWSRCWCGRRRRHGSHKAIHFVVSGDINVSPSHNSGGAIGMRAGHQFARATAVVNNCTRVPIITV